MCIHKRISVLCGLGLLFMGACAQTARTQTSLQGIQNPDGSRIVYGPVEGADDPGRSDGDHSAQCAQHLWGKAAGGKGLPVARH